MSTTVFKQYSIDIVGPLGPRSNIVWFQRGEAPGPERDIRVRQAQLRAGEVGQAPRRRPAQGRRPAVAPAARGRGGPSELGHCWRRSHRRGVRQNLWQPLRPQLRHRQHSLSGKANDETVLAPFTETSSQRK